MPELIYICILFFVAAALYSSVGHAGASAYLAIMSLFSMAQSTMKPTALILNVMVATITSIRFAKASLVDWRLLLPFAVGSVPLAYLGGMLHLPGEYYRPLVGVILLLSATRLVMSELRSVPDRVSRPHVATAFAAGGAIGLISGLTGTGGGIFLSPLLIFMNWSTLRAASGVAAVFILANSISGLAGNFTALKFLPNEIFYFAGSALLGALLGSWAGTERIKLPWLGKLLMAVLIIAGLKLILT